MTTSARENRRAFAVWLTGLPSSGKSSIARALAARLRERGFDPAVLESDALRSVLTPNPTYSDQERDTFYGAMLHIGRLLVEHDVPVIFDATANRRRYRDAARTVIARFFEVYVATPLDVCAARDPKGLYRAANDRGERANQTPSALPGVGATYEPPLNAEVRIDTQVQDPDAAAHAIVAALTKRGWLGGWR